MAINYNADYDVCLRRFKIKLNIAQRQRYSTFAFCPTFFPSLISFPPPHLDVDGDATALVQCSFRNLWQYN